MKPNWMKAGIVASAAWIVLAFCGCGTGVVDAVLFPEVTGRMRAACRDWTGPDSDTVIAGIINAAESDRAAGWTYQDEIASIVFYSAEVPVGTPYGRQDYLACMTEIIDDVWGR